MNKFLGRLILSLSFCSIFAAEFAFSQQVNNSDSDTRIINLIKRGGPDCAKACLEGFIDDYLEAIVANDPSSLPLSESIRYSENGQHIDVGDGLWATATGNSSYRLYVTDPVANTVAFLGLIEESGVPAFLTVRMKIEASQITEIETVIAREGSALYEPEAMTVPFPILIKTLGSDERSSRQQMVTIANSYFSGLDENNSGRFVPFDDNCLRRENGLETAGSSLPDATGMRAMACAEQFNTGFSEFITDISDRRFLVIDEERGLIFTSIMFQHAGTVKTVELTSGDTMNLSGNYARPFQWMIAEIFKIQSGKIRQIEALLIEVPYGMTSGW